MHTNLIKNQVSFCQVLAYHLELITDTKVVKNAQFTKQAPH